ncbi:MAG: hypothetical protein RIM23_30490 [Coleofasciculus sp. G3-WIS-01]|uniref:hypothetical protein n=1 Tax=Coleofasciculus sp. G3-WIS-01 TaxID=3069528 RepID=UPI003303D566
MATSLGLIMFQTRHGASLHTMAFLSGRVSLLSFLLHPDVTKPAPTTLGSKKPGFERYHATSLLGNISNIYPLTTDS